MGKIKRSVLVQKMTSATSKADDSKSVKASLADEKKKMKLLKDLMKKGK